MKACLLDIDGTTLLGPDPLPGAIELVTWLRAEGIPLLWLTNNTSMSRGAWLERLATAGLGPKPEELYTAGDATIDFLHTLEPAPRIRLVGTADLRRDFEAAGLTVTDGTADAVVLGYDTELTYAKIRDAALLLQAGAAFYATHPDLTCPTPKGPIPDVGSFLAMFQAACGVSAQVIGKPESTMVAGALARVGVAAHETIMVGDRLATDIAMARRAGLTSALVLTGVTAAVHPNSWDQLPEEQRPHHVFEDLAAVLAWARL